MAEIEDRVLLEAARAGDGEAFGELVRRHQDRVFRVALRMLGSEPDAQDAAQETFVRAWRSLGGFRGESSVSTWLYRIAVNRCLNVIGSRRPGDAPLQDADGAHDASDPAAMVETRSRLDAVSRAVAGLPADQRAALVLRDFEGLSYAEVAEVLGIEVGAVKSRIHRGREQVLKRTVGWR